MSLKNFARLALATLLTPALAGAEPTAERTPRHLSPPTLPPPNGYSHAVVVSSGTVVYLAGQVPLNAKGELVGKGDFRAQAAQAFENLRAALTAAGATPANIVRLNYYVVGLNREKLGALREVRDKFIDAKHAPASTLLGVEALFREDCLIEIEATAVIP